MQRIPSRLALPLALALLSLGACSTLNMLPPIGRKTIQQGAVVEGREFTVRCTDSACYVKRFDKSHDALILEDSTNGLEGYQYAVFPIAAEPGELPAAALLRHYARYTPSARWEVVATRKGDCKDSAGQVDFHLRNPSGGGVVATCECFRDGTRYWVTTRMLSYLGRGGDLTYRDWLDRTRSDLKPFAGSFRRKSAP